jgi:hypothetical protein
MSPQIPTKPEKTNRRRRSSLGLLIGLTALFAVVPLLSSAPALASTNLQNCGGASPPKSNLVEAGVTSVGETSTYTFKSATGLNPTNGVPGLIEYCVFPGEGNSLPTEVVVDESGSTGAEGFNGEFFNDPGCPEEGCFAFTRADGNESNIPFDGTERTMGTATWEGGTAPAGSEQEIRLHINDKEECEALGQNSETCFVLPGKIEENPPAADLEATKDAHPSLERTYKWEIEKEVVGEDKAEISSEEEATFNYNVIVKSIGHTDSGWLVTGTIEVDNPDSGAVTGVEVTDAIYKGVNETDENATCEVEEGSGGVEIEGETTKSFAYKCQYSGEPEAEEETNIAVVSWPEQTVNGSLLDQGSTEAEAEVDWASAEVEGLDESINLEDSIYGSLGTVSLGDLENGELTIPYELTFPGEPGTCKTYENTASFETSDTKETGEDSADVEVCVGEDLEVSKTAEPTFKRKYPWELTKVADKEEVKTTAKYATFNYTINVTKGAPEDSGWLVKGKITVKNPNDWESVTVNVADEIENDTGAECSVSGGTGVEIQPSGSEEFEYECLYTEPPASSNETNKATATWEGAHTPNGSASGTAAIDWGSVNPATEDNCVTEVTDTVDGEATPLAEQLCESKEFKVKVEFEVKSGCTEHTNVASAITEDTEEELSDEVTVRVCGPVQSGALTMGFWQNKNGQEIIKKSGPSTGTCSLTSWLLQFNPFKDLPTGSTCKQVAEYVNNVIKAANAGGATMNAMLKGQMLATALDVYFSESSHNAIKAPSPIGALKVDLTKVCTNIPSCTKFVNASSAFGGATSMTVLELLEYAASKSDAGGKTWYEQKKSIQELAKDTFDAINNQVAFEA